MVAGKQPAYGGEEQLARLRRFQEEINAAGAGRPDHSLRVAQAAAQAFCQHPATYIALICVSCSTVMEIEG